MWRAVLASSLLVVLTGCAPTTGLTVIEASEFQRAAEPSETGWRPVSERGPADGTPIWYRATVPAIAAPDPAVMLKGALFADLVLLGERRLELRGMHVVPMGNEATVVTLRAGELGHYGVPKFIAGSEKQLWSSTLVQWLPPFVVGMMMVLAGLLLLSAGLRKGAERAYRGLGLFFLSLGVLYVLNTPFRHLTSLSGTAIIYAHELGTTLYPVGFVDFVLGIFGDGPRGFLRKGLRVFAAYAVVAWVLHFAGLVHIIEGRAPVAFFIVAFLVQAIVLAARRSKAGDTSATIFLWGIAAMMVISMPDILDGSGLVTFGFNTVPYAILVFGVAMVAVIERQHTQAREDLAAKLKALEDRNREINSLNAELRHQIAERSKQLGDALQGGALITQAAPLEEGEVIDGRYRVGRRLGKGGMGAVHHVQRLSDGREFAMKIMSGSVDPVGAARFAREAEIAARVADEHLVKVADVGGSGTGRLYIVMELVEGRSLDDQRARFGDVPWALPLLEQVARGVRALHAAGVVHRDLKPANVLLSVGADGKPLAKISDFGISRLDGASEFPAPGLSAPGLSEPVEDGPTEEPELASSDTFRPATAEDLSATLSSKPGTGASSGSQLTGLGAIMGTPAYMAPELMRGAHLAQPASDMFALGLIAYELLAGKKAFERDPFIIKLTGVPLPVPPPLPREVPAALGALVVRCLAEAPAERPTVDEFLTACR